MSGFAPAWTFTSRVMMAAPPRVDEFVACFTDAANYDPDPIHAVVPVRAGTPEIVAQGNHDAGAKTYTLEISTEPCRQRRVSPSRSR